ncbi:hypothetical protein T492DRAFT_451401 [Pavlovales sp. CCMP2436]|nr:hypothetical protein T492DRAFT_451401 [Pavlovales sp. CCMP2436]
MRQKPYGPSHTNASGLPHNKRLPAHHQRSRQPCLTRSHQDCHANSRAGLAPGESDARAEDEAHPWTQMLAPRMRPRIMIKNTPTSASNLESLGSLNGGASLSFASSLTTPSMRMKDILRRFFFCRPLRVCFTRSLKRAGGGGGGGASGQVSLPCHSSAAQAGSA